MPGRVAKVVSRDAIGPKGPVGRVQPGASGGSRGDVAVLRRMDVRKKAPARPAAQRAEWRPTWDGQDAESGECEPEVKPAVEEEKVAPQAEIEQKRDVSLEVTIGALSKSVLWRKFAIDIPVRAFLEAGEDRPEAFAMMSGALFSIVGKSIIADKAEAEAWIRAADFARMREVLLLMGFDPFLLNIEGSSLHVLVCLLWVVWRADLWAAMYADEGDASFLPPWGDLETESDDLWPPRPCPPEMSADGDLSQRVARLVTRIRYRLEMLSDLELMREQLHWRVRSVDPDTSLYALSLRARPDLLQRHIDALRRAVAAADAAHESSRIERAFWRWAAAVVNRVEVQRGRGDGDAACEWFPSWTTAPFSRWNTLGRELEGEVRRLRQNVERAKALRLGEGSVRQRDQAKRAVREILERLRRGEQSALAAVGEGGTGGSIPRFPFRDFSDLQLRQVTADATARREGSFARAGAKIAAYVRHICESEGLVSVGWGREPEGRRRAGG